MNTRRISVRRLEEERVNEDIPKVEQVPEGGKGIQGAQGGKVPL